MQNGRIFSGLFRYFSFVFLSIFIQTYAQAAAGTEGAAFLDIPVGAGPAALGSAYSALARDAYAPIYNPAGLGLLKGAELSAQHLVYLESIDYEYGSFVIPIGRMQTGDPSTKGIGASIQYLGSGNIAGTDPSGNSTANYSSHYAAYSLAYGQKISDHFYLGITGKTIQAELADISATAFAADLGALYEASDRLALAATANNLGSKLTFTSQSDSLPTAFHISGAYQFEKHLKSTLEAVYSKTGLFSERLGTEWSPLEVLSLRAGYRTDTTKELSAMAGLTVGLGVHVWGQEFSYAWLPYGDLGNTQYFSLLLRFGKAEEEKKNLIQYQSIKKHRTVEKEQTAPEPGDADDPQLIQLFDERKDPVAQSSSLEKKP